MEYQERLHMVLSCLRHGRKTARDIAEVTALDIKRVSSILDLYRRYNYIFKRQHIPNKKRFIWALTKEGKKKLESLDLKFAPEKTALIDLTISPYCYYDKVLIRNGNEKPIIEFITKRGMEG